jgi:hypothetical protein
MKRYTRGCAEWLVHVTSAVFSRRWPGHTFVGDDLDEGYAAMAEDEERRG